MLNTAGNAQEEADRLLSPHRLADSGSRLVYASPEDLFRCEHESLVRALAVAAGGDLEEARDPRSPHSLRRAEVCVNLTGGSFVYRGRGCG